MDNINLDFLRQEKDFNESLKRIAQVVPASLLQANHYMTDVSVRLQSVQEAASLIARLTMPAMEAIRSMIAAQEQVRKVLESFAAQLPTDIEMHYVNTLLYDAGYGFTSDTLELSFARSLKTSTTAGNASTRVTNHFVAVLRTQATTNHLSTLLSKHPKLEKRKPQILAAHKAFVERKHHLAAPSLLAQLEGIVSDLLVITGDLKREGTKYILLDGNVPRLNSKGRLIYASGLNDKISTMKISDAAAREAADYLLESLIDNRNGILHGSKIRYAAAKLNIQTIIMITIFSEALIKESTARKKQTVH
jgi:hypothetical protein